jgi:glycosyltransferase involved in cell wall biosynthesis
VSELLQTLDVFVLTSLNEGLSNTILEAMATGLPVIATAVGGNGELVVDGETGSLVAPSDVDALAARLARYRQDPALAARHGRAGRSRVVAQFSLAAMVSAYGDLYRSLHTAGRA